jgi:hypothetical protein
MDDDDSAFEPHHALPGCYLAPGADLPEKILNSSSGSLADTRRQSGAAALGHRVRVVPESGRVGRSVCGRSGRAVGPARSAGCGRVAMGSGRVASALSLMIHHIVHAPRVNARRHVG